VQFLDGSNTKQFYDEITGMHGNVFSVADGEVIRALIGSALSTCRNGALGTFERERSQILYHILFVPKGFNTQEPAFRRRSLWGG
jgi:hypothetical protein